MANRLLVCLLAANSALAEGERPLITSSIPYEDSRPGRSDPVGAPTTGNADDWVLYRNRGALYAMYGRALRTNDKLEGKIVFQLTISAEGTVTDCRIVSSELRDEELERKMVARIRLIHFGARSEPITITWSMDFFPAV